MGRNVSVKERCVLRVCVRVRYSTVAKCLYSQQGVCVFGRHNVANIDSVIAGLLNQTMKYKHED